MIALNFTRPFLAKGFYEQVEWIKKSYGIILLYVIYALLTGFLAHKRKVVRIKVNSVKDATKLIILCFFSIILIILNIKKYINRQIALYVGIGLMCLVLLLIATAYNETREIINKENTFYAQVLCLCILSIFQKIIILIVSTIANVVFLILLLRKYKNITADKAIYLMFIGNFSFVIYRVMGVIAQILALFLIGVIAIFLWYSINHVNPELAPQVPQL